MDGLTNTPTAPHGEAPKPEHVERVIKSLRGYAKAYSGLHRDIADDFRNAADWLASLTHASADGELREALNGYRAAVAFIAADSWDGCSDCIETLKAARNADWQNDLHSQDDITEQLKRIRKHGREVTPPLPETAEAERVAREALASVTDILQAIVDCSDPDETVADGGITAWMAIHHDAKWARTKVGRAIAALSLKPDAIEQWQDTSTAPHACHVLASRFDNDAGEWVYGVVLSPPTYPWTSWMTLPEPPAIRAGDGA